MKIMLTKAKLYGATAAVMATLSIAACSSDNSPATSDTGRIATSVQLDASAITSKGRANDQTAVSITASDLAISLTSADGSYNQSWASPDLFPSDKEFKTGLYTLTATYGDGKSEGFDKPYYFGETQVRVVADQTTGASLTATLANAMVSVSYTDAFTGYMSDYSAELTGKSVFFSKEEDRPAYVNPGNVILNLNVTKPNGKSATFSVANFTAAARHHYHITVDLNNGAAGDAVLNVIFDDLLDEESLTIDLSDELFDAPAPSFTPAGIANGETIELIEGTNIEKQIYLNLIAKGGIRNVNLLTNSAYLNAIGWPASADLVNATEAERAAMTQLGLVCRGIWNTPDKMAVIDFSGLPTRLQYVEGSDNITGFTLSAVDNMSKTGDSFSFYIKINPVVMNLSAISSPILGDRTVSIDLEYNGHDAARNIYFECLNERGSISRMEVVEMTPASDGHYTVVLSTPDIISDIKMNAVYVNGRKSETLTIVRNVPDFEISADDNDVFAHTAKATLTCSQADPAMMTEHAKWAVAAENGNFTDIKATISGTEADLSGLTPGTKYTLRATIGNKTATVAMTTEADTQLPNSNMDQWFRVAGKTKYWWIDYPGNGTDAVWGTMNLLTTSVGDGNTSMFNHKGTSYCAFSGTRNTTDVHSGTNAAIISTVGWGDNDANGSTSVGKGCKNLTVGELYLGHYDSASKSAIYTGISHNSRPESMRFWYKYTYKNSTDYGTAEIQIKDASGNIIARASESLSATDTYTQVEMPLTYSMRAKAANIVVIFKSSGNPDCQTINTTNLSCPSFGNLSDGRFTGSELYIDDIELIY